MKPAASLAPLIHLAPRWRKVWRDLWQNRTRTLLVVTAIAVGVFAFGSMFITQTVLLANLNQGYAASNPATITLDAGRFGTDLLATARTLDQVSEVDARLTQNLDLWTGSEWKTLNLVAIDDPAAIRVNRVTLESGTLTLRPGEILLERETLAVLDGVQIGDSLLVELPDGSERELRVVGSVHDFSATPATRGPVLTAYATLQTTDQWGLGNHYDDLLIVTDPGILTRTELEAATADIISTLERAGYDIRSQAITEPGEHWASDFITAVTLVLLVLGLLALALSGFLVINTISAIILQQKRQIGIMKAIGAQAGDIMGLYLGMAAILGLLSLGIALPVGAALSRGMVRILADFLNIDVLSFDVPNWVRLLEVAAALAVPALAALVPVLGGMRISVREAITDYGIKGLERVNLIDRLLGSIRSLPRPVMLSLRNTFRRKGRLALTVTMLALAGGIFMAVINTRLSVLNEFDSVLAMFGYDVQVQVSGFQPAERLERESLRIEGVTYVEPWVIRLATVQRPEGVSIERPAFSLRPGGGRRAAAESTGVSTQSNDGTVITLMGPPPETLYTQPQMVEGRWLQAGDQNVIVLSTELLSAEPYVQVGDTLTVSFDGREHDLEVIGIVSLVGPNFAYTSYDWLARASGRVGQSNAAMLATAEHSDSYRNATARELEESFQARGLPVSRTFTPAALIGVITSQVDFFVAFMVFMALLLGAVGGLGLASTMSLNVVERTREIGVMRAVGASDGAVNGVFLSEGLLIGFISYLLGAALSLPISWGFCAGVGLAFFNRPIAVAVAPGGLLLWLLIGLGLSALASYLPARQAASISVRESLAYQ